MLGLAIVFGLQCVITARAFVAYQVRDRVHTLGREVFGRARVQTELLNVPPMRIYRWEKHATPVSERL